jgi:hypothetical protein
MGLGPIANICNLSLAALHYLPLFTLTRNRQFMWHLNSPILIPQHQPQTNALRRARHGPERL